jgi:hypothetical protein
MGYFKKRYGEKKNTNNLKNGEILKICMFLKFYLPFQCENLPKNPKRDNFSQSSGKSLKIKGIFKRDPKFKILICFLK